MVAGTNIQDVKKCVNCGEPSNILYHIIPRSEGGQGTVPVCNDCHSIVHGEKRKALYSTSEITKRGLDHSRIWELFAVKMGVEDGLEITSARIKGAKKRLAELENFPDYADNLFLACGYLPRFEFLKVVVDGASRGLSNAEIWGLCTTRVSELLKEGINHEQFS